MIGHPAARGGAGAPKIGHGSCPSVLTLSLDPVSQAFFDKLRRRHFPPARLLVGAHVTMFHALPPRLAADLVAALSQESVSQAPFLVRVSGVLFLGRGVAYRLESPRLSALRERLRGRWAPLLTRQDSQPWRPHVTVQNKADPSAARALHGALSAGFRPWTMAAERMALWEYADGPWRAAGVFPFRGLHA